MYNCVHLCPGTGISNWVNRSLCCIVNARKQVNEAVIFSQPLDLLVISGSGLKVGVVSQKNSGAKKEPPLSQS